MKIFVAIAKHIFSSLIFVSVSVQLLAQEQVGLPNIKNYNDVDIHAQVQNWAVIQNTRRIMYFKNNQGVLQYIVKHISEEEERQFVENQKVQLEQEHEDWHWNTYLVCHVNNTQNNLL